MRVLLLDDHPLVLSALSGVVSELSPEAEVVSCCSAVEALACLHQQAGFDLALLDLHLRDADGFQVLTEIRRGWPDTPVVVVSGTQSDADAARALGLGAMGFVPKRAQAGDLKAALQRVLAGGVYVPEPSLPDPMAWVEPSLGQGKPRLVAPVRLTRRQGEVLALLRRGYSNKEIARELALSTDTVKDHVQGILRSFGASSRTQAVMFAQQYGGALGESEARHD